MVALLRHGPDVGRDLLTTLVGLVGLKIADVSRKLGLHDRHCDLPPVGHAVPQDLGADACRFEAATEPALRPYLPIPFP